MRRAAGLAYKWDRLQVKEKNPDLTMSMNAEFFCINQTTGISIITKMRGITSERKWAITTDTQDVTGTVPFDN